MIDLSDKIGNGGATSQGLLTAAEFNHIPAEIQNAILSAGIGLLAGDQFQLAKTIASYAATGDHCECTGSPNTLTMNPVSPRSAPATLENGTRIRFLAKHDNTGAATAAVYGSGQLPIRKTDGFTDIVAGDIQTGTEITLVYRDLHLTAPYFELQTVVVTSDLDDRYEVKSTALTTGTRGSFYLGNKLCIQFGTAVPVNTLRVLPLLLPFASADAHVISIAGIDGVEGSIRFLHPSKKAQSAVILEMTGSGVMSFVSIGFFS